MPNYTDRLELPIPALGEQEWRSIYVDAFEMIDDLLGMIGQAGGLTFIRRYDDGWPDRGELPSGSSVIWVKPTSATPNPSTGGTGLQEGYDLVVIAVDDE